MKFGGNLPDRNRIIQLPDIPSNPGKKTADFMPEAMLLLVFAGFQETYKHTCEACGQDKS